MRKEYKRKTSRACTSCPQGQAVISLC